MERKKKKRDLSEEKTRMIGIGSIGHSVGCTHFGIMTVNYLAGVMRRKAALLEWNDSGDFEKLELVCTGRTGVGKSYRVLEADYYKNAGPQELADVLMRNYDDVLIDFGNLEEGVCADFLRCEKQFLIGSFSEWREGCFREFVRKNGTGKKSWSYLAVFGSEETRREFMRRPGIYTERIPFSADSFAVTKETYAFLKKLV